MSEHRVNIIEIDDIRPHGNAERLEIVPIGGWQAVVKKGQFSIGMRAVYIEPDYCVPTARPEFAFLAKEGRDKHRLKAVRLRGTLSFGLLIPAPDDVSHEPVGADVMAALGIERYEPPIKNARQAEDRDALPEVEWPKAYAPKFDVESLQRFPTMIVDGEPVLVTEKIHGANARYLYEGGAFFTGSRNRWLRSDAPHIWTRAADADLAIRAWCEANPGSVLYGEIYGPVQSLRYSRDDVRFAAFAAIRPNGEWVGLRELIDAGLPFAPVIYEGPWSPEVLAAAEHDSTVEGAAVGHMREGIVIVPTPERRDPELGRVILKYISNRYWESEA